MVLPCFEVKKQKYQLLTTLCASNTNWTKQILKICFCPKNKPSFKHTHTHMLTPCTQSHFTLSPAFRLHRICFFSHTHKMMPASRHTLSYAHLCFSLHTESAVHTQTQMFLHLSQPVLAPHTHKNTHSCISHAALILQQNWPRIYITVGVACT